MNTGFILAAACAAGLFAVCAPAGAAEAPPAAGSVALSPGVLALLREEMREVAVGVQRIPQAIAVADWQAIAQTGAQIRASYIMEKKLTPAQVRELEDALPERFKALDAEFHARAGKLGAAAAAHDAEAVVFQFSRMLESCTACHSAFAGARFPAFATAIPEAQMHAAPPSPADGHHGH